MEERKEEIVFRKKFYHRFENLPYHVSHDEIITEENFEEMYDKHLLIWGALAKTIHIHAVSKKMSFFIAENDCPVEYCFCYYNGKKLFDKMMNHRAPFSGSLMHHCVIRHQD